MREEPPRSGSCADLLDSRHWLTEPGSGAGETELAGEDLELPAHCY